MPLSPYALGVLCATLPRVVSFFPPFSATEAIRGAKKISLEAEERRRMYTMGIVENEKLKKALEGQSAAARGQKIPLDHGGDVDID
jgi:hypothetical protein